MAQNNVYNKIPGSKESWEAELIAGSANSQNNELDYSSVPPSAYNQGSPNTEYKGKKKAKEITFQNLEGDIEITPTPKNFRIVSGMTIQIVGVGKFLSGFYFVMSRSTSISGNNAMSIRLSVIKTKFGDSLKGEEPIKIETTDLIGDKDTKGKSSKGSGDFSDTSYGSADSGKSGESIKTKTDRPSGGKTRQT